MFYITYLGMRISHITKAISRPREFSVDEILDKSAVYFRRFGYHSASVSRLEEHYYQLAFDRYVQNRHSDLQKRLTFCKNARDKLHAILMHYAEVSHGQQGNDGCMVFMSAVELSSCSDDIKINIKLVLLALQTQFVKILEEAH